MKHLVPLWMGMFVFGWVAGFLMGLSFVGMSQAENIWDSPRPQVQQPFDDGYVDKWLDRESFRRNQKPYSPYSPC